MTRKAVNGFAKFWGRGATEVSVPRPPGATDVGGHLVPYSGFKFVAGGAEASRPARGQNVARIRGGGAVAFHPAVRQPNMA